MTGADPSGRGPLWVEFTRAQGGQAINHLARSFHLPRPKAKAAVLSMLGALTQRFDEQTVSRGTLARLIELLGKNDYEQVLETPALMGATSTQVIGNDALTALAGREESSRIASRAATAAGISEMIAEYLLPVVAAMFMGALSAKTRSSLYVLMRGPAGEALDPHAEPSAPVLQFPVGRGSSGFFAGTGSGSAVGHDPAREAMYLDFAARVRDGAAPGTPDPLGATRRAMAVGLGVRARHAPWFARLQKWGTETLKTAGLQTQERLRALRSRRRDGD
ncbi:MAG: DUF937 domain-containing protein [Hyphomicrobium sp.]|nr:DUF937 domain-containing protein [Hyphomicrobium sp.]